MPVTAEIIISDELMSEVSTSGDDDMPDGVPQRGKLQAWATAAYLEDTPAIASMLITTAKEIQKLNKQYRDKDKATNVLSFPIQSPEEVDIFLLGDIVLCAAIIKQEAEQQKKSEESHWAHMVVHAMLHLQGYDHVKDDDAKQMEQLEVNVLHQLGYDNPY